MQYGIDGSAGSADSYPLENRVYQTTQVTSSSTPSSSVSSTAPLSSVSSTSPASTVPEPQESAGFTLISAFCAIFIKRRKK